MKKIFGSKSSSEGKEEKGGAGVSASPPVPQGYSAPPIAGANTGYGAPPPYSFSPQDACGGGASSAPPPPEFRAYDPPPAYSEHISEGSSATVQYGGCLEQQMYQQKYLHQHVAHHGQANAPPPQPGVVVHAEFDKYARFTKNAPPSIPPPPPGVKPTAAQLAAMHGGTVVMTQKKGSFF